MYAFSLFVPSIISGLGYKSTEAQLLTVPPYAAAAIATVAIGFLADRTGQRGLLNIGCGCLGIVGFIMLISTGKSGVQYAGLFLGAMGIYPCIANTIVWAANNTEGVYKRGITMGFVIGWGNLNGTSLKSTPSLLPIPHPNIPRHRLLQYLPRSRQATLPPRPRRRAGVPCRIPRGRKSHDASAAASGEHQAAKRAAGPLGAG